MPEAFSLYNSEVYIVYRDFDVYDNMLILVTPLSITATLANCECLLERADSAFIWVDWIRESLRKRVAFTLSGWWLLNDGWKLAKTKIKEKVNITYKSYVQPNMRALLQQKMRVLLEALVNIVTS